MSQMYYRVKIEFAAWGHEFPVNSVHAHGDFDYFSEHDENASETLKRRVTNGFLEVITEDEALAIMEQQEEASAIDPANSTPTSQTGDSTQPATGNGDQTDPANGAGAGTGDTGSQPA